MKKLIKPAVPGASVPDVERGRDLPAEGLVLDWTPHWALMERRGDIVAEDPPVEVADATTEAAADEAAPVRARR
ncbi:hypothetical protein NS228_06195 [Methylobacterium indicum]|uniref:hypothetical protein n=1 Tax=Methylobacterium indicum TaxID=1775910 RepID=UPI00073400A6|nr:hypothetical protein [Methylobacterium indicum]KTS30862.1 hypothetical protein NS229_14635 [Methylobacterium indicum]KTS41550.1 hypothetical protein NS228_06195 [Methylobacterium indicum]KTS45165.1 hypothetical protein NS230_24185 [Methylobacterium indicum]